MATMRRPIHLGIAVGVSASVYAVSLAAVTGLQSADNARIAADNTPLAGSVDRIDSANRELDARLAAAGGAYDASASAFSDVADRVAGFEGRLKALAGTVARIHGSSVSLPSAGALPSVPRAGAVAKPPVHTTTSASGHGP